MACIATLHFGYNAKICPEAQSLRVEYLIPPKYCVIILKHSGGRMLPPLCLAILTKVIIHVQ